ncbi:hypothetical protein [Histidinibacterium aquaticum]|uniref:Uncharacterized protein n=1 Tax=Histidinibacterium aquaticum TaxID=2613962 RepID=A0A5J5GBT8_9RHOB|nr:hypothetical protein [Histidinibacterium aquaticum]KAA9005606.1 hypothetical protein F3S47_17020 [Histidinibacterium aquaticum]
MDGFLQPDPVILAFIAAKQGIYLLCLLPLALIRSFVASGGARWAAIAALVLCLLGLAARYLPEVVGAWQGPLVAAASFWRNLGGGLAMNLVASAALILSAVLPGRRWWALDVLHGLLLAGLLGLWGYSLWS